MEQNYLIDTNIIIYYLKDDILQSELEKVEQIFKDSFNISTITKIELLGWQRISLAEKNNIELFLSQAKVHYIDERVEKKAIELKQNYKMAIPDAIIAATSLLNNFIIVTRNSKDFEKINEITIYNPFENIA